MLSVDWCFSCLLSSGFSCTYSGKSLPWCCHSFPCPSSSYPSREANGFVGNGEHPLPQPMMGPRKKITPPHSLSLMPCHTNTTAQEAFAVQSIEILLSLDSTSKAVSTLNLMPLTSIRVGFPGAIHLDTMYVLEPMYNLVQISRSLV